MSLIVPRSVFFFFNDTATTEIYTLSLHDALPILDQEEPVPVGARKGLAGLLVHGQRGRNVQQDRKSTRLNSSHSQISYAVFCLKKKKNICITDESHILAVFDSAINATHPDIVMYT